MISLETARKLKEAGLQWEPQMGDFWIKEDKPDFIRVVEYRPSGKYDKPLKNVVWIPRLDQLLAEIEKRGYRYILLRYDPKQQKEGQEEQYEITLIKNGNSSLIYTLYEDSIDEVTAQALMWILELEKVAE